MRSASLAASLILASAWFLARIGTYSGSKSFSMSTPSWLLGRSMTCPFEAITVKPRPRNLESVRDLVGDSTITSDLPRAAAAGFAAFPAFAGLVLAGVLTSFGARAGFTSAPVSDALARAGRGFAPERPGAAASASAARTRSPVVVSALRALVRLVEFAMVSFQPSGVVALEGHAHRHLARQIHAHRPHPAAGEEIEHALELAVVQRPAPSQVDQVAPCRGAQGLALLVAPHPLSQLAGRLVERRRGLSAALGLVGTRRAAQRQDRRLDLVASQIGLLDRLAQGFEHQLLALMIGLEALGEDPQQPRRAVARGAHEWLPTPSSIGIWHFLYFLPLPHGQGSLRPTRGPVRTTGAASAGPTAGRPARPPRSSPASSPAGASPPPNAWVSACWVWTWRGARGCCSIARTASGASCTRNRRWTKSSRTSVITGSNSV